VNKEKGKGAGPGNSLSGTGGEKIPFWFKEGQPEEKKKKQKSNVYQRCKKKKGGTKTTKIRNSLEQEKKREKGSERLGE